MLNAAPPPTGPKNLRGSPTMRGRGGSSRGGISKRSGTQRIRVDKDGDLDMDAPARPGARGGRGGPGGMSGSPGSMSTRGSGRGSIRASGSGALRGGMTRGPPRGQGLVEITVLGWVESKGNRDSLVDYLERKSAVKIKKSRVQQDALIISVPFLQVGEVTKWDGCNFAGSTLSITAANAPKISSRKDDEMLAGALSKKTEKSDTIKILETVLIARYDPNAKMLDLSRLGEDPTLRQTGFFDLASTTSKMFPALMLVADRRFETPADKRNAVHSVSLAYNNLKDLRVVASLAPTFPELKNLSLEGNLIPTWKEMDNWKFKFRKLEQLILAGNPIVTVQGYKEEAIRRYPSLTMLDGVMLDRPPPVKVGQSSGSERSVQVPMPLAVKSGCVIDESGVGMQFLASFFSLYDTDRDTLLATFYDEQSKFSLQANTMSPRRHQAGAHIPSKPWEAYYPASRNLTRVYGGQLISKLYIGTQAIRPVWSDLPRTKHDIGDGKLWAYDVWPIQGLPDINNPLNHEGVSGLIAMVHGEFEDVTEDRPASTTPFRRSFDRTFTLAPGRGPMGLRVVNDMLCIRAWSGHEAWQPEPISEVAPGAVGAVLGPEEAMKQQKMVELARRTGLNAAFTELCLAENGWDFDRAFAAFEAAKAGGLLPPGAFV